MSAPHLAPGTVVDRYTVEFPLGAGGMAWVYAVRHTVLDTAHALKVLHAYASSPSQHDRLVREGRLQARLDSPHVVPVTDVIRVLGAPALVMPRIDGCSLAQLLAVHRPSADEALALFAGIVEGVRAAHRAGIVHRDLKPANVMLDLGAGELRARVTDFGVAKALRTADGEEEPPSLDTVGFVGTPAYASPEQRAEAREVAPGADLWSLGIVLAEMLVGRRPRGPRDVDPADPRGVPPLDIGAVPARWRALVARLLQADPVARMPTADALAETLAAEGVPTGLGLGSPAAEAVRRCQQDADHDARRLATPAPAAGAATTAPLGPPVAGARLPRARDAFVGRGRELAAIGARWDAGAALVTLVGMGGTGKTRLAIEHAVLTSSGWTGGVWFCDLSDARSVDGVAQAVGHALGVPLTGADPVERLGHAIAQRGRCLVVLDNVEVVRAHAPATLGRWLELAPNARFLVTSREVLGLRGEEVLTLEPLELDSAVTLFVRRAEAADPGFQAPLDTVRSLCHLLDGLPLAIELAAARVRVLGPAGLLSRMGDRFRLLAAQHGPPTGTSSARHATMRAAIDWSWDLLGPHERDALARLSVFEAAFDLDAAEAVLVPEPGDPEPPWTLDLLQALVDRSLVRALGDGRFGMLHNVRAYARERLSASGREPAAAGRHGRYFAAMGSRAAIDALHRAGGTARRRRLEAALPDLLAAHRRAAADGDAAVAADAADAVWQVLLLTGPPGPAVAALTAALQLEGLEPARRVQLMLSCGSARLMASEPEAASALLSAASEQAAALGDAELAAAAVAQQAVVSHVTGRIDEARRGYEEALAGVDAGNPRLRGMILRNLGALLRSSGEVAAGLALEAEALALHRGSGDRRAEGIVLRNLGLASLGQWRLGEAEAHLQQALAAHREVGDRRLEAQVLGDLGVVYCVRGELATAVAAAEAALTLIRTAGDRRGEGQEQSSLGVFLAAIGRERDAEAALTQALALQRVHANAIAVARTLANLAALWQRQGRPEAEAAQREALALAVQARDPRQQAECRAYLARAAWARGDRGTAAAELAAALEGARSVGQRQLEADVLAALGGLAAEAGDAEGAAALVGEAEQIAAGLADPVARAHVACERLRLARLAADPAGAAAARAQIEAVLTASELLPTSPLALALRTAEGAG